MLSGSDCGGSDEVDLKSFGFHGLTVELPSLVDSPLFKHFIGQPLSSTNFLLYKYVPSQQLI